MNFMIVCGGTGGHLFPGMALGEELLLRGHQVLLVLSKKEIDQKAVEGARGFLLETLPAVGWRGIRPDRALGFAAAMGRSLFHASRHFRNFDPNAVVGMGGFSSFAPVILAWRRGIPSLIHDSNAIPGRANRLSAHFATRVALGLEEAKRWFPSKKTVWTGTPVRPILREKGDRLAARKEMGLDAGMPTVLVMGGSQGARGLNRRVVEAARIMGPGVQWIHLAGERDEASTKEGYESAGIKARVMAFSSEMFKCYSAADLVVARAGASSLAEISQQGLPSILVPYPYAADLHQDENARIFFEAGAAVQCRESMCKPDWLAGEIQDILRDDQRRSTMGLAALGLQHKDAHRKLADLVEELAEIRN